MGCSICLDGFGEDDATESRPACLPCGHVYHHACADKWLRTEQREYCPLCGKTPGKTYKAAQLLSLFPSAPYDINRIQAAINDDDPSWRSALRGFTDAEAHKLFDDLMDLNIDLQAWMSAVVGVRVVATKRAGERVHKFIAASVDKEHKANAIKGIYSAVQDVVSLFERKTIDLDGKLHEVEQQRRDLDKEKRRLQDHIDKHKDRLARVAAHERANEKRSTELREKKIELVEQQEALTVLKQQMKAEVESAKEKALESAQSATRAHIEARQTMAAKEIDLQRKQNEAADSVAVALTRQCEAETERDEVRAKNHTLADTMRTLQKQLQEHKAAKQEERNKRRKAQEDNTRELLLLRQRLAAAEGQLRTQGPDRGSCSSFSSKFAKSDSPSATIDAQGGHCVASSPLASRVRKRPCSIASNPADESLSLLVEDPRLGNASQSGIDNGWESDELDAIPMPGMPRHRGIASNITVTASTAKVSLPSSRVPFTTKSNSSDNISLSIGSLAAEGMSGRRPQGKIPRTDPAMLAMSKRAAGGRRQRIKEGQY